LKAPLKFPASLTNDAKALLKGLLERNPAKRFGVDRIKKHAFFSGTAWDKVLEKKEKPSFVPECASVFDLRHFDPLVTREAPRDSPPRTYNPGDPGDLDLQEHQHHFRGFSYTASPSPPHHYSDSTSTYCVFAPLDERPQGDDPSRARADSPRIPLANHTHEQTHTPSSPPSARGPVACTNIEPDASLPPPPSLLSHPNHPSQPSHPNTTLPDLAGASSQSPDIRYNADGSGGPAPKTQNKVLQFRIMDSKHLLNTTDIK
jgi:hypothetical protein